jgi:hypothetical protein
VFRECAQMRTLCAVTSSVRLNKLLVVLVAFGSLI